MYRHKFATRLTIWRRQKMQKEFQSNLTPFFSHLPSPPHSNHIHLLSFTSPPPHSFCTSLLSTSLSLSHRSSTSLTPFYLISTFPLPISLFPTPLLSNALFTPSYFSSSYLTAFLCIASPISFYLTLPNLITCEWFCRHIKKFILCFFILYTLKTGRKNNAIYFDNNQLEKLCWIFSLELPPRTTLHFSLSLFFGPIIIPQPLEAKMSS